MDYNNYGNVTACLITREKQWPDDVQLNFNFAETLVATESPNVLRRFELAAAARCEHVYVQDDDNEISQTELWAHYCLVTRAQNQSLLAALPGPGFRQMYAGTGVTLIGFGAFFPRRLAEEFLEAREKWLRWFDEDTLAMEADRLFTWQHRFQTHNVIMPVRQIRRPVKMCERPGHYHTRDRLFKQLKEIVW